MNTRPKSPPPIGPKLRAAINALESIHYKCGPMFDGWENSYRTDRNRQLVIALRDVSSRLPGGTKRNKLIGVLIAIDEALEEVASIEGNHPQKVHGNFRVRNFRCGCGACENMQIEMEDKRQGSGTTIDPRQLGFELRDGQRIRVTIEEIK